LKKLMSAVLGLGCVAGMSARGQVAPSAKELVNTMVAREVDAASHKQMFAYVASERSERTGGHMWTEHVVETPVGRVRFLLMEDGKPLSAERMAQERGRLANDLAHPDAFEAKERAEKDDEAHARQMLEMLPRAFVFDNVRLADGVWRMDFHPNPAYSPSGTEEKVLHGMSGYMLIDQKTLRMKHIEGRMPQDMSMDLGLVSVKAGSFFLTDKAPIQGQWRTARVVSDIRAKAALLKTIAKNTDVTRMGFHRLDAPLNLEQAIALAEEPPAT